MPFFFVFLVKKTDKSIKPQATKLINDRQRVMPPLRRTSGAGVRKLDKI